MRLLFEFFRRAGGLKCVYRHCIKVDGKRESSAEHSWRLALMASAVAGEFGLDSSKAVKLALVHDLLECIAGDTDFVEVAEVVPRKKARERRKRWRLPS
ncbi:TPA: HD domain-containing protein [Candidatus Micrarchaeota archaeon]|nr:HD domain-containing protein [Candidatus Micrarchaeota archaeon]